MLFRSALNQNRKIISVHFYTESVNDSTVAASEMYSTRSDKSPYLEIISGK